jgi:hypothetical protein
VGGDDCGIGRGGCVCLQHAGQYMGVGAGLAFQAVGRRMIF